MKMETMDASQKIEMVDMLRSDLDYNGIEESTYGFDHPDVVKWTEFFESRTRERAIFEDVWSFIKTNDAIGSYTVATQWYRFSSFMPAFLCRAASKVSDNVKRHYIIQTAFEELGMRNVNEIHPEMFKQASLLLDNADAYHKKLSHYEGVTQSLDWLRERLNSCRDDYEVMGMLLGLEIPAEENIDTIFQALAQNSSLEKQLKDHMFFRIHLAVEVEHVRLTVSNFLRFCDSQYKKDRFIRGFEAGLDFWELFWDSVNNLYKLEKSNTHTPVF